MGRTLGSGEFALNYAVIVQARMGSNRLPGKVLKDLGGHAQLWHVLQRIEKFPGIKAVVVATTTDCGDDLLEKTVLEWGYPVVRGEVDDVLSRYFMAAQWLESHCAFDALFRVTGDNPLTSVEVMQRLCAEMERGSLDYVRPKNCPLGLGSELIRKEALEVCYNDARELYQREHVTPYVYQNPHLFKMNEVDCSDLWPNLNALRLTVDAAEDYEVMAHLYRKLYRGNEPICLDDLNEWVLAHSEEMRKNSHVEQKLFTRFK